MSERANIIRRYDDLIAQAPEFRFLSPVTLDCWLADAARWMARGRRLLEVGVGRGELLYAVKALGGDDLEFYHGIDISRSMLGVASNARLVQPGGVRVQLSIVNVQTTPLLRLAGAPFDTAVAINVLQDMEGYSASVVTI